MKYIKRQILLEKHEGRSEGIDLEKAIEFFRTNCSQYNPNLKTIYRGVRKFGRNYSIVKPSDSKRPAGFSDTTYLNFIDGSPYWKDYPKRRESIICTTHKSVAYEYGTAYVVIPTNNAKIAVAPEEDFQECFDKFHSYFGEPIYRLDEMLPHDSKLRESGEGYSFEQIKQIFEAGEFNEIPFSFKYRQYMEKENLSGLDVFNEMLEWSTPDGNDFMKYIYNGKTKMPILNDDTEPEVWTDADCLLIRHDHYYNFINEALK